ncbi:Uncharacterised protein [Rikenella microfusus]|uniref:Uncharacterized protein n=1 Tax=Rikenella microfusus TaxID=28139 RepID=A0A379MQ52_9BACT|nr:Uncharacterised protein [Rikenella microfusus]
MGLVFFQADIPANVCHLRKNMRPMLFYMSGCLKPKYYE